MKKFFVFVAAISSMVALNSCSEQVMNEAIPEGQSLLRVQTRSETPPQEGKVYVFNSDGDCVRLLTTEEGSEQASTHLIPGNYTIYAVGGEDLSKFTLPDQENANTVSLISLAEGKTMGDLLLKSSSVTLTEGGSSNLELELERQVIKLKEVTIKKVPADVTKVEVSISPLYQGVQLNGTYSGSGYVTIELVKSSDNTTWTNGSSQPYCFPSDGKPTITVGFTTDNLVKQYSYKASETFEANHQVVIEGTFQDDAVISMSLTTQDWDTDQSESFSFDENNLSKLLGYSVVSLNSSDRSAVLLRKGQEKDITTAEKMALRASQINKPAGLTCGNWRLPTIDECQAFLLDTHVYELLYDEWYYCQDNGALKAMKAIKSSSGVITIEGPISTDYDQDVYYRPVIDVNY